MKKYEIYLDPITWVNRDESLLEFQDWLKSVTGVNTKITKEPFTITEHQNIDTLQKNLKKKYKNDLSLKIHKINNKQRIVLKFRSMDPLLVSQILTIKTNNTRIDQTFYPGYTIYSIMTKTMLTQPLGKTFESIENLFPGFCNLTGILPTTKIAYSRSKFVCNLRKSVKLFGKKTFFKLSLLYSSLENALSGQSAFHGRFIIEIKRPIKENKVWLQQLSEFYKLFYDKICKSKWNYCGPVQKVPVLQQIKPRTTREYQIYFDPEKWQNREDSVASFRNFLSSLNCVKLNQTYPRFMEHFALDTNELKLKSRNMDEVVVKLERNLDTHTAQLTCKYKGYDLAMVNTFPITVNNNYKYSSKIEQDYHPKLARMAISLAVDTIFEIKLDKWADLENIFSGLCEFLNIDPQESIFVRLYKVKWEETKQKILINDHVGLGKISLEYPSFEDAKKGTNLFHGQWSFRIKRPYDIDKEEWLNMVNTSYELYYNEIVPCIWTYEGTHTKPDLESQEIPSLN